MGIVAGEERDMTIDSHTLVLDSSISSIQNLFTKGNQGILFTSYIMQNPPLQESSLLWKLCLSKPRDLLSVPSVVLPSTALYLSSRDSPLPDSLHLCTCSSLLGVQCWYMVVRT